MIIDAISCDLNEEIIYYYNNKHENEVKTCWFDGSNKCGTIELLNFTKINPINYKKISFIGESQSTMGYWGNTPYTGTTIGSVVDRELTSFIKNEKSSLTINDISRLANIYLQVVNDKSFLAGVTLQQSFGSTFYWENGNYYLQVLIYQYGEHWLGDNGRLSINLGNGIKLYNDNNYSLTNQITRSKRDIGFDYVKKSELENSTKWTNDFTKNINNEQHLVPISNDTNYVTNNITAGV